MLPVKNLIQILQPLIASNSVSSDDPDNDVSNRAYCEILANYLENLNFYCEILPVPKTRDKWNLIAHRLGSQTQTGGLMFSGHSDTVPAIANAWNTDPWQLTSSNDKLQGLGATDMKGFFAVLIGLLQSMPRTFAHPITIIATADEETSMAGARAINAEQLLAPALNIIGEPTECTPIISHKGYLGFEILLASRGGHSSQNTSSINCIEAMHSIITQLIALRNQLQQHKDDGFSVPVSTINFGVFNAGDVVNRICARASLQFDIRPLPGFTSDELHSLVVTAIEKGLTGFHVTYQLSDMYPPVNGFTSTVSSNNLQALSHCCQSTPGTANYVTEASLFESKGIPSVVLGPGNINQAHTANEWLDMGSVAKATEVYRTLINQYCAA